MGRVITACVAVLLGTLAFSSTVGAITYGSRDYDGHPEVGALLAPVAYSDGTWATCSGTLISPTVFLTAAHCDQGVSRVAVTFDSSYVAAGGNTYWGTWRADPRFRGAQGDPYDTAVVVFDKEVKRITPARLPEAGSHRARNQVHVGRLRRAVGDDRQGADVSLRRHPLLCDWRPLHGDEQLVEDLDEPGSR